MRQRLKSGDKRKENKRKLKKERKKKRKKNLKVNKTEIRKKIKKKRKEQKAKGTPVKGILIIGRCQSPLLQPAECGCAITEPDYLHPRGDAASLSGNSAGSRNGGTGKTV